MVSKIHGARIDTIADRFFKPEDYYHIDRSELLAMLPQETPRVLDVGCGAGASWNDFPGEVHGVEYDPESATQARENLAGVIVGDIQKMDLPYEQGFFDCIVFADVLEHLYDPWGTILRLRPFLAPGGILLISLPNIRYYKVVRDLVLKANFAYTRSGVLDIDHVRFFARRNVQWLLEQTGFEVEEWRGVRRGSSKYRLLNSLMFGKLEDFLTRQFLIRARAIDGWQPSESTRASSLTGSATNGNTLSGNNLSGNALNSKGAV